MNSRFNQLEAKRKITERREREDLAPRLHTELPQLSALRFVIESGDTKYTWHIVVERAPALFDIACTDPSCQDGGHDVTMSVMRALRQSTAKFNGEHVCRGQVGIGDCGRPLRYAAVATFTS